MSSDRSTARLITFPPSIDSEIARFLLTHYGISYREEPHSVAFLIWPAIVHGKIPVFVDRDVKLNTSMMCRLPRLSKHWWSKIIYGVLPVPTGSLCWMNDHFPFT